MNKDAQKMLDEIKAGSNLYSEQDLKNVMSDSEYEEYKKEEYAAMDDDYINDRFNREVGEHYAKEYPELSDIDLGKPVVDADDKVIDGSKEFVEALKKDARKNAYLSENYKDAQEMLQSKFKPYINRSTPVNAPKTGNQGPEDDYGYDEVD